MCGYQKGVWSRLPLLYEAMTEYAEQNGLTLSGYAYEVGMNEFMISAPEDVYKRQILDEAGRVVGRHRGYIRYTVGQRRGLGIAAPQPLYAVSYTHLSGLRAGARWSMPAFCK